VPGAAATAHADARVSYPASEHHWASPPHWSRFGARSAVGRSSERRRRVKPAASRAGGLVARRASNRGGRPRPPWDAGRSGRARPRTGRPRDHRRVGEEGNFPRRASTRAASAKKKAGRRWFRRRLQERKQSSEDDGGEQQGGSAERSGPFEIGLLREARRAPPPGPPATTARRGPRRRAAGLAVHAGAPRQPVWREHG